MIKYEFQGRIAVITGASKDEEVIEIPEELEGMPVAKIETNAFVEMPKLRKVVIPKSVKVIGGYAFASCPALSHVELNEGLETIEDWAFISCNIDSVRIPKSVKSIGLNAFLGNMCKEKIDAYIKEKDTHKLLGHSNGHCAAFPIELMQAKESITSEIVTSRARYIDDQFDKLDKGEMTQADLDIPFYFDGSEFMRVVCHKKEMPNVTLEVAGESKPIMGIYSENDPDFLVLKVNVLANSNLVSSFFIKTPYLEGITFTVKENNTLNKDGVNYCFIHCICNEAAYGNGNYDREFAVNHFNELDAKFKTELNNKLITEDQYQEIRDALDQQVINITQGFLDQIDGCPKWTYLINLKRKLEDDEDFDRIRVSQYIFAKTVKYYNELHDIYSLMDIVFNTKEHEEAIQELTGMDIYELGKKYDLTLTDAQGMDITEAQAEAYKDKFLQLETNYLLHGDFLVYIYKEMQKMLAKYSLFAFSA